jgi:TRAP-type mannitol/chloroaromatic compound transport system permease small subunit
MRTLLPLSRAIDKLNGLIGQAIAWATLLMILIGAYNAIIRYLGRFLGTNLSSNVYLELQWYLFSAIFLLGAAWTLKEDAHVRVDVLFDRVSPRSQRMINVGGALLLLLPFCVFVFWTSVPSILNSWSILEGSPDPGGLPRYPIKSLILVSVVLLGLQGISELIKDWTGEGRVTHEDDTHHDHEVGRA